MMTDRPLWICPALSRLAPSYQAKIQVKTCKHNYKTINKIAELQMSPCQDITSTSNLCCDNVLENQPCFFGNRQEPVGNLNNWMTEWLSTCTMLCGLLCQWQGPTQMHPQAAPEQKWTAIITSARKVYKNKPTKKHARTSHINENSAKSIEKKNLAKYIETGEFGCSIKKTHVGLCIKIQNLGSFPPKSFKQDSNAVWNSSSFNAAWALFLARLGNSWKKVL